MFITELNAFAFRAGPNILQSVLTVRKIVASDAIFHLNCSTSRLKIIEEYVSSLIFHRDLRVGHFSRGTVMGLTSAPMNKLGFSGFGGCDERGDPSAV
jgi:hypothetical protein